jgi:ABC-type multidrug transport system ATPase subunit
MDPDGSIDVLETIQSLVNELNMKILISSHKTKDCIVSRTSIEPSGSIPFVGSSKIRYFGLFINEFQVIN